MKVAVSVIGSRVSPRFDCATGLLVAEVRDKAVARTDQFAAAAGNPLQRIARLRELGVDVVVCGAVTGFVLRHLVANGVRVYPWVTGDAGEALEALARGELATELSAATGPGRGRGRGRWCQGRRGPRWSR